MKRALLIFLVTGAAGAFGQVDVKELVDQSIRNYQRDWLASRTSWTYTQTDVIESEGTKEVAVSEVIPLDGTPYDRLIGKDGHPLTPAERRKEERKYEHALREREKESFPQREARIRKYENERAFVHDIPNAYNFKLLGEESVEGRPAFLVEMTPRPDFVPAMPHGSMLSHIEGKLWIDKQDVQWAKAEAHVIETIGIGWILARIGPGTRFSLEQTRVENGLWMPRHITIAGSAHVMLFYSKPIDEELSWSGYRKEGSVSAQRQNAPSAAPATSQSFR